jgi:peptidoglycan/LPS O-acetylase OafA/YrhL
VLRGFAVLLVLGVHVPAFQAWAHVGWLGVDLFFVLSGFLVSNLLFSEYKKFGELRIGSFLLRRGLKIYPSFYFLFLCSVVFVYATHRQLTTRAMVAEALFVQNYFGGVWGHTWSLAVEEHFYILLALALLLMALAREGRRNPFRSFPLLFALVAISCIGLRYWTNWYVVPFRHGVHFQQSHLRLDSLLFGVLVAYFYSFHPDELEKLVRRWHPLIFFSSLAALAPNLLLDNTNPFVYTIGFTLVYLGFGGLMLIAIYSKKRGVPGLFQRMIASIGVFSYSIYLWHVPLAMVFAWIYDQTHIHPQALFAIYVLTSIAVGTLLSKLIEIPILRLRDRLLPRRA